MGQKITALKTSLFTLIGPGTVTILIPYIVIRNNLHPLPISPTPLTITGALLILCGALLGLGCAGLFTIVGKGTPAPIDPPKILVAVGAYRFVRNPMYIGVLAVLYGEALFFHSIPLTLYALAITTAFHLFTVFYEEPALRKQFGKSYEDYCANVSRWLPKIPPRNTNK